MALKISQMAAAGTLDGAELVELAVLSASITITAATISAAATDNSFNDSGSGFVAAGFDEGDQINVSGFTGDTANNIVSATVTALTAAKMTIGGTDGDVIVDDAAGESVTITKWTTVRTTAQAIGDLGSGGGSRSPAIQSVTSAATVTPTFSDDLVRITAQAAALTLANPTGTAIPGLGMVIRIKDDGTARAISYGSQYRAIGITLPTTTVLSKTTYLAIIFNDTDTKWDVVATGTEA